MKTCAKFLVGLMLIASMLSTGYAESKWKTLVFTEDINQGLEELKSYCTVSDIKLEDVLWANNLSSTSDIKPGTSIYLPMTQGDMLAIWQYIAKPIIPTAETEPEPEIVAQSAEALTPEPPASEITDDKDVQAKFDEISKLFETPSPASTITPAPDRQTVAEIPQEAPTTEAKPDKILTSSKQKSASKEFADPIIVLSPNGDPTTGPMRLIISGNKVEVVELPQDAAPKRPSVDDIDAPFTVNSDYMMPYYNLTIRPRDNPILNIEKNLSGKMLWPVDGKISSYFGMRGKRKHEGIDIPMPQGTPIRAARNGIVARTGNNSTVGFRGYGNFVLLDHGGGLQTLYAHCSSVAVVPGQRIMQGQVISYVGNTGRSTANHLHFEVRVNNTKVNPIPYLAGGAQLAAHK